MGTYEIAFCEPITGNLRPSAASGNRKSNRFYLFRQKFGVETLQPSQDRSYAQRHLNQCPLSPSFVPIHAKGLEFATSVRFHFNSMQGNILVQTHLE